tara:strand:+ start:79 stop:525 length:447 start_codon:yes stop_codon:yes gene_type:complete
MRYSKDQKRLIKIHAENPPKNIKQFQGIHLLLELYGCNSHKLNDELFLRDKLNSAAKLAQATVLNLVSNKFEPYGVTAIALLAESHLSIHTWPESQYSAIDIFTCGKNMEPDLASQYLIDNLEATKHSLKKIYRDNPICIQNQLREAL